MLFVLTHPTEYDIVFEPRGDVVAITEDDDPVVELPVATARALWRAAVSQGYRRDDEAAAKLQAFLDAADDYESERWAEAYNDARIFGWDHNDALAVAGGYA